VVDVSDDSMGENELRPDAIDAVVSAIYDASARIASWDEALRAIAAITESDGAAMRPPDDGATGRQSATGSERGLGTSTVVERSDAATDLRPRRGAASGPILQSDVGNGLILIVARMDPLHPYVAAQRAIFGVICEHVRRAVTLSCDYDRATRDARIGAAIVSRLELGVVLINPEGGIVRSNAVADSLIGRECWLLRRGGRLLTADRTMTAAFGRLTTAPATGAARRDHAPSVLLTAPGADILKVTAVTLPVACQRAAEARTSRALFLAPASDRAMAPDPLVAEAYRLTAAEARVFAAAARGIGMPEVAAELRIGVTTVRSHLKQIFAKTGTRSQSDLIRFVAGWAAADLYKRSETSRA
jgi:DNA-binding CsgD family transcriptional regulator